MAKFKSKSKVFGFLMLASIVVVAFQNCSFAVDPNLNWGVAKLNGNGTGYDGKPYGSYGDCGNGVELKSKIVVNAAGDASLVRDNCQDLAAPTAVDPSTIAASLYDQDVFVFSNKIFDPIADTAADVHFTRMLCWTNLKNGKVDAETAVFADAQTFASGMPTNSYNGYVLAHGSQPTVVTDVSETMQTDGTYAYASASVVKSGATTAPAFTLDVDTDLQGTVGGVAAGNAIPSVTGGNGQKPLGCFMQALPRSLITVGTL